MEKFIGAIFGIFIFAALYSLGALIVKVDPYNFNQTTWVGEIFLLLWHILGCCVGYHFSEDVV